jgi:class 3 adenylate cyclase
MGRYYRLAREAVFRNEGMLDKFIGDAVLAVFGYPLRGPADSKNAILFAQELVDIGKSVLSEWSGGLNAIVESGTRVGIATGEIWPINIGDSDLEVALLGDTINLAARLEKNCARNGYLMDNRTKRKAAAEDSGFVDGLNLVRGEVAPGEAKGQQHPIRTWCPAVADFSED